MNVRKTFHQNLEDLYLELLKMAGATVEDVEKTRKAFDELDAETAQEIIEFDDVLDDFTIRIEENGIELLATQAPVAIDLRNIIVIMRITQHLERVGDLCVNISKAIKSISGKRILPYVKEDLSEMFSRSERMLLRAIEAFKKRDISMAEGLTTMDDAVDRINRKFLTGYDRESEEEIELAIRVVMISRFIERIADHAVDIGEQVQYLVTGKFAD
ncbi:MAG: phosphate signaling complex protein PhoU [Actinomycetota bacterium]|nr:phosphate signaling complex protein PhoU [Actinomycetota bacterium]